MSEICALKYEDKTRTDNKCQNMIDGHKDCFNCIIWHNKETKPLRW